MEHFYSDLGVYFSEIYMPNAAFDLNVWATIACDQFTSEVDYWRQVDTLISNQPSTGHLVLPEIWLEKLDTMQLDNHIQTIQNTMNDYLDSKKISSIGSGMMLIDRQTPEQPSRKGVVLAIDLEQYDFLPHTNKLIRATEETVVSRLPPRIKIRQNAALEFPHIMLLINDPQKTVIETIFQKNSSLPPSYQTPLMLNGGSINGRFIPSNHALATEFIDNLSKLHQATREQNPKAPLFVVGDGNHSLAAAKESWNQIRALLPVSERDTHPARFALVEVVNFYDSGLSFEPIHRLIFQLQFNEFKNFLQSFYPQTFALSTHPYQGETELKKILLENETKNIISMFDHQNCYGIEVITPLHPLDIGTLQLVLDHYLATDTPSKIDYIHGISSLLSLRNADNIGFYIPNLGKDNFFTFYNQCGIFPRKTFSLGEAWEKRYYLEGRKIN